jgi:hypothetical protein
MMRVIIAGSRSITQYHIVQQYLNTLESTVTTVVCGGAKGVDTLGERWAKENNKEIQYFRPDWDKHGKSAGVIRNEEMAKNADYLVLIWDGKSKGSAHMLRIAKTRGLIIDELIIGS